MNKITEIVVEIEKLKAERGVGLVSVSINTHKTYPEYEQDEIALKNILKLNGAQALTKNEQKTISGGFCFGCCRVTAHCISQGTGNCCENGRCITTSPTGPSCID